MKLLSLPCDLELEPVETAALDSRPALPIATVLSGAVRYTQHMAKGVIKPELSLAPRSPAG